MDLEDQQRFQVEAVVFSENTETLLTCDRCDWSAVYGDPLTLAELNQRADEHTEVCR